MRDWGLQCGFTLQRVQSQLSDSFLSEPVEYARGFVHSDVSFVDPCHSDLAPLRVHPQGSLVRS